jgi:ATP-binding cassette, subfamily F, member 3
MVSFNLVSRHYGTQDVLTKISFEIHPGQKIGLIGPNSAGKTTLVRILIGEEETSEGSVSTPPGIRIGHVPQHVEPDPLVTVSQYMLGDFNAVEARLRAAEEALAAAGKAGGGAALRAYQSARDAWDALGGDELPRRA